MKTNVGRKFLQLIDKHFPKENPLSKVINRQKVKMSYKNTPNMKKQIAAHNAKILGQNEDPPEEEKCNCRVKGNCPVEGQCQKTNVV